MLRCVIRDCAESLPQVYKDALYPDVAVGLCTQQQPDTPDHVASALPTPTLAFVPNAAPVAALPLDIAMVMEDDGVDAKTASLPMVSPAPTAAKGGKAKGGRGKKKATTSTTAQRASTSKCVRR